MTAEALLAALARRGQTLAFAESVTGGLLADAVVRIPGASRVFLGSAVCYQNSVKQAVLGVSPRVLRRFGAVSPQCAAQMAQGAKRLYGADIALAVTGYAQTARAGHGYCYYALRADDMTWVRYAALSGGRNDNRNQAARAVLALLSDYLRIKE